MRRVRRWAWDTYTSKPSGWSVARVLKDLSFAVANRYDRDPNRCWLCLALWAMGHEGYELSDEVTPGCTDCGKCLSKPVESDGDRGKP
jgi:hypothetical protein